MGSSNHTYKPPLKVVIPAAILLWLSISIFNTGIFVFSFDENGPMFDFSYAIRWTLIYHSPWIIISPCILYLGRKFPLNEKITFKNLFIHLVFALLLTLFSSLLHTYFISIRIDGPFLFNNVLGNFLFYSVDRLLIYFVILVGYYAVDYYRKQNEEMFKEVQFQETINRQKLNSFKNNIQPGFLLNTLADIEDMVIPRPEEAEQLIANLAQRIREMLKNSQKEIVHTIDDLHFLKSYINILGTRLNREIYVHESLKEKDKKKGLAISLFVIGIVEQLLNRDENMFRAFDKLQYESFETDHSHGIKVLLERLLISHPTYENWFKQEGCKTLARPFSKTLGNQGSAKLSYTENGTLLFSINLQK